MIRLSSSRNSRLLVAGLWLSLLHASAVYANDLPIIRVNGLDYSKMELSMELQQSIYELEAEHYRKLRGVLDQAALDLYLADEAQRTGRSKNEVSALLFAVGEPGEAEVRRFYDANRQRIRHDYQEVKGQIAAVLKSQSMQRKMRDLLEKLERDGRYQRLVVTPVAPYAELEIEGYPQKGAADAAVTIVEFADYQCPHCVTASNVLKELMQRYGDRVRLVFKDYPINRSGLSRKVAEGAACAAEQGQFWPYHYRALKKQAEIDEGFPIRLAKELSLDEKRFQECLDSGRPARLVAAAEAEAKANGITSTPTVFVNGRRLQMFNMEKDIETAIEAALNEKG